MATKLELANLILQMSYGTLMQVATEINGRQTNYPNLNDHAKMASLLYDWAEAEKANYETQP